MCPPPWSQRAGDLTWEPSRLPGLEWVGQMPSAPLLLLLQGPSRLPLLISPASLLCPQGPTWPGGGFGGGQPAWELSRLLGPSGPGNCPPLLSHSPRESLPPASPNVPSLRGADPVEPPLLLPPQSPYVLPVHSGVPPASLGIRVPHQQPAGALVVVLTSIWRC